MYDLQPHPSPIRAHTSQLFTKAFIFTLHWFIYRKHTFGMINSTAMQECMIKTLKSFIIFCNDCWYECLAKRETFFRSIKISSFSLRLHDSWSALIILKPYYKSPIYLLLLYTLYAHNVAHVLKLEQITRANVS